MQQLTVLTPLTGTAKTEWKPFRLTSEQIRNIQKETRKVPAVVNGTLYIPEGTVYLSVDYKEDLSIKKIVFPSTFKGNASTSFTFEGCSNIKELEFSKANEYIIGKTFLDCTGLEKVTYNGEWTDRNFTDAFKGCTSLTTAVFTSSCKVVPSHIFRNVASLTDVTLSEGIEEIGYGAFWNCSKLTNFTIPSTVKEIGGYAFYNIGLKEVYVPSTVETIGDNAFSKSVKIICEEGSAAEAWAKEKGYSTKEYIDGPEYTITNGVLTFNSKLKSIEASKFKGNGEIREVVIGENITKIGNSAFEGCPNLKKIQFNAKNVEMNNSSSVSIFKNCPVEELVFGPKVEVVPRQTFRNLNSLKSVRIPGNVKEVQMSAFYGDKAIEEIVIEEGVETLVEYCFYGLPLKKITLPSTIKSIEANALPKSATVICPSDSYAENYAIQNGNDVPGAFALSNGVLTIKEGIKSIPDGMYTGNTEIREVIIPSTVTKIGADAFKNCTNLTKVTYKATSCTNAGTSVTAAFLGCTNLSKVIIAEGVTTIPANIFRECPALKQISFPSSLKTINSSAFYKTSLEEIVIPQGVETIAYTVFSSNSNLKTVRFSASVKSIQNNAFDKKNVKFYAPKGSYAEQWCKDQKVDYTAE